MLVVGHRGASAAAPENTREAFALAEKLGADAVELDVRVTLDEKLVICHHPLPNDPDEVAMLLTLDEALDSMSDEMLVNVEMKNSVFNGGFDPALTVVGLTLAVLRHRGRRGRRGGDTNKRWLLSSWSLATIGACRTLAPEIETAVLCRGLSLAGARRIAAAGHTAAHPHVSKVTRELVENCHTLGLAVNTYTCNDPDRIVALRELEADGVFTDQPDTALSALGRRPECAGAIPQWAAWPGTPA
jgi:glycerophosphoryl diester phosphodiesterase